MLAVQGPRAREIVEQIADSPLPPRMQAARRIILGHEALVCGTGYTGEDGVELLLAPDDAASVWEELLRRGVVPCGLAARDTLRLEVCYPLYGNDLSLRAQPDRGRPRLGLQGGHGLHRLRGRAPRPRGGHRRRSSSPSRSPAPASRARATRSPAAAR